ncbi:hypothetical protein VTJ04DRAFT_6916 [Mycothermus thermophilus]|uniref:uncharacterized protein n=1 Tax=Humicola insolens TaxID=85995 RepID=UPI00374431A9
MSWTPEKVVSLLKSVDKEGDQDNDIRVDKLKQVLAGIKESQEQDLSQLSGIVEKLADAARDESWRIPLGGSGLLDYVLSTVPVADSQHPLNKQALRLVGNACADCDENRARVVASGTLRTFIMSILADPAADAFLPFAIAAALNVCVDYKPAQEQASEAGLSKLLVDIISGNRLESLGGFLSQAMTIFELLCNLDNEPKVANPKTPIRLLELAVSDRYDADLDSFLEICTPALAYLTYQDLQPVLLEEHNGIQVLQQAFHQLYTRFDITDLDSDTTKQLKTVGDAFLSAFADISALPTFPSTIPLTSPVVDTFLTWLSSPSLANLQTAACLVLGNLARSDDASTALLNNPRVLDPIVTTILWRAVPPSLLPSPPETKFPAPPLQLIHASLGLLKNLAIPAGNKPVLGGALLDPPRAALLPRLWSSTRTQPQLQFAAVSLARLLLANCPANAKLLCAPLPVEEEGEVGNGKEKQPSNLALLLSTAFSADEDPIKIEAARAASQVCRALYSSSSSSSSSSGGGVLEPDWTWPTTAEGEASSSTPPNPTPESNGEEGEKVLTNFHTAHAAFLTRAFTLLLTHPRFPTLKSEAIFSLALMARSNNPGAASVALQVFPPPPPAPGSEDSGKSQSNAGAATGAGNKTGPATWHVLVRVIAGSDNKDNDITATGTSSSTAAEAEAEITAAFTTTPSPSTSQNSQPEAEEGGDEKKDQELPTIQHLSLTPQQPIDNKPSTSTRPSSTATAGKDRENALVLLAALLARFPSQLSPLKPTLERVLARGGELVMRERQRQGK